MKLKIRGGTLFETIVAMIIILSVFGIVTMIISKMPYNTGSRSAVSNELILSSHAEQVKTEKKFVDQKIVVGSFEIIQTVSRYESSERLYKLKLILKDQSGRELATHFEIITE